jgi:hypothetical protein
MRSRPVQGSVGGTCTSAASARGRQAEGDDLGCVLSTLATDAAFHLLVSPLNVGSSLKTEAILVTTTVLQSKILPFIAAAAVGPIIQCDTAVPMFVSAMVVSACAPRTMKSTMIATAAQRRLGRLRDGVLRWAQRASGLANPTTAQHTTDKHSPAAIARRSSDRRALAPNRSGSMLGGEGARMGGGGGGGGGP